MREKDCIFYGDRNGCDGAPKTETEEGNTKELSAFNQKIGALSTVFTTDATV